MDFSLTEEQRALRDRVELFARDALSPGAKERDAESRFPAELWRKAADFGLLGMATPSRFHPKGEDTDYVTSAVAMEALGYGCSDTSLAFAISAHMWSVQHPIAMFGSDEAREKVLPGLTTGELIGCYALTEEDAGSDHLAIGTEAVPGRDGYALTGEKRFVTLGPIADLAVVFASTDPTKGRWGVTAFLVELQQGVTRRWEEKMGLRSIPFGTLTFAQTPVPETFVLGEVGSGASIASSTLAIERTFLFASQVGAMRRNLERAIDHASTRRQFQRSISGFQSVSNRIADMRLDLESARLLLYHTAWKLDRGEPVQLESALLKLHVSEAFHRSTQDLFRIFGGKGYLTESEVERDIRDSIGGLVYSGTSDIQRVLIARMLGL